MSRAQPISISSSSENEADALPSFIPASTHLTALRDVGLLADTFPTQFTFPSQDPLNDAIRTVPEPEYIGSSSSSPSLVLASLATIRTLETADMAALMRTGNTRADRTHHPYSDSRPPSRVASWASSTDTSVGPSTLVALDAAPALAPMPSYSSRDGSAALTDPSTASGLSWVGANPGDHPELPIDLVSISTVSGPQSPPLDMGSALRGGRITTGAPSRPMELEVPSRHASPPSPSGGSTPKQHVMPAPTIEALEGTPSWPSPGLTPLRRLPRQPLNMPLSISSIGNPSSAGAVTSRLSSPE